MNDFSETWMNDLSKIYAQIQEVKKIIIITSIFYEINESHIKLDMNLHSLSRLH